MYLKDLAKYKKAHKMFNNHQQKGYHKLLNQIHFCHILLQLFYLLCEVYNGISTSIKSRFIMSIVIGIFSFSLCVIKRKISLSSFLIFEYNFSIVPCVINGNLSYKSGITSISKVPNFPSEASFKRQV